IPDFYRPIFYQQAARQLVVRAALAEEASRMGLKVTDAELANELHQGQFGADLFPSGNFVGKDKYAEYVYGNFQLDVPNFERLVKQVILLRKHQTVVQGGAFVSQSELQEAYKKQNVKVKFDYALLKTSDLEKKITVTDAELHAYYEKNKASLANAIPEQRK